MKFTFLALTLIILASCGTKVPYTDQIKEEFALDAESNIKKVQFYTSSTIILERSKVSGNQGTGSDGSLVTNQSKEQDRVIIPVNTKGVFESFGEDGSIIVRFETGVGRTIKFALRQNTNTGKYYLVADWKMNKGGEINYGNDIYTVESSAGNTYLLVLLKKLNKTKRKDRVVKGMKV